MRYFYLITAFLIFTLSVSAQEMDAKQINSKMTEIRRNTNWDNAAEAKKANEEIQKLSKQLMLLKQKVNTKKPNEIDKIKSDNVETNMKLWKQMMNSVEQGKESDILLGKPIRDEIVEEYKDDESPVIKSQEYLDEMTLLVIDMSLKTVQRTIDQMDKFKSIKALVITGGENGAPVSLSDLLTKAKNYPLEELYIINFKNYVSSIPVQVGNFKKLTLLSLVNNKLNKLPAEVGKLDSLKALYIDINPVNTVIAIVGKLKRLENLGIGKTSIAQSEIDKIKQQLPNCKILMQ